ncbi:unnamed protein product [Acanthosepion pharaonis]|uniref:Uncharacterized protein n=1 Tax=Acanthosepion pharaonis TaxID=158019 RepID=A0A812CCI9_ACAPH|nr:unnamed protein product [Sepia pharaonis]
MIYCHPSKSIYLSISFIHLSIIYPSQFIIHPSIYLSIHPYLSIHLHPSSIYLSFLHLSHHNCLDLFKKSFILINHYHLSIYLFINLSIYLSIYHLLNLSIYLLIYLSGIFIFLFIFLIYVFIYLFFFALLSLFCLSICLLKTSLLTTKTRARRIFIKNLIIVPSSFLKFCLICHISIIYLSIYRKILSFRNRSFLLSFVEIFFQSIIYLSMSTIDIILSSIYLSIYVSLLISIYLSILYQFIDIHSFIGLSIY